MSKHLTQPAKQESKTQTARLKSRIPQYGVVGGAIGGISQLQLLPSPLQRNCIYRSNNFSHIEPPRQCCLHKHRCARSWTHGRIFPKMFNVDNDPLKLTELPCLAAPLKAAHRLFSSLTFLLSGRTLKAIKGSQTYISLTLRHYRLSPWPGMPPSPCVVNGENMGYCLCICWNQNRKRLSGWVQ